MLKRLIIFTAATVAVLIEGKKSLCSIVGWLRGADVER